jgi:DNA-binding winged helix-turn-helix (wHTH) protein
MTAEASSPDPVFALDKPNQLLWRNETPIKVPPKVFQLLAYFRDNPGRILEYEELLDAVWPREFVQPEILKTYIKTIRRLLEDDAQTPRFIETRARCGYSFIGRLPDRSVRAGTGPSRLIGREKAIATMQAALSAAEAGQSRFLFVVGEAGIGKTRAIDEFLARVDEINICRVDCAPAQHARQFFSPAREIAAALEESHPDGDDAPVSGESLFRRIDAVARDKPLVLVIENLQWADAATIEALSRLAYVRSARNLFVLGSYRASMPNDPRCPGRTMMLDLIVHGLAQELRLRALDPEDVKRLVLASTPVPIPRGAVDGIERYAGGNPLIVSAIVQKMVEQVREHGQSELAEMLALSEDECEFMPQVVPEVIRHSLELQLRDLGASARSVLECGSNSGYSFCAWGVAKVLGMEQVEVEEMCKAMCGSDQLLRESSLYVFPDSSVTPVYSFRNPLYARLLLAGQSHARRNFVQQRFTDAVEQFWGDDVSSVAVEMAERFEAVREWTRALHYAKLAVANAVRHSRNDARSLLERGLRLSEHLPRERRDAEKRFFLSELATAH